MKHINNLLKAGPGPFDVSSDSLPCYSAAGTLNALLIHLTAVTTWIINRLSDDPHELQLCRQRGFWKRPEAQYSSIQVCALSLKNISLKYQEVKKMQSYILGHVCPFWISALDFGRAWEDTIRHFLEFSGILLLLLFQIPFCFFLTIQ